MEEILNYYYSNWELITPIFLLSIEIFLRKIPTFSNVSLVHYFNLILDFFVSNKAKLIVGRSRQFQVGKFITDVKKLKNLS